MSKPKPLYGMHERSFDKRNRFQIPAEHREHRGEHEKYRPWVITLGIRPKTLSLYPLQCFEELEGRLGLDQMAGSDARRFELQFFGSASHAEPDDQGRIVVPENLRKIAGLEDTVVLVGQRNRVDVFSKSRLAHELGIDWDAGEWPDFEKYLFGGGATWPGGMDGQNG